MSSNKEIENFTVFFCALKLQRLLQPEKEWCKPDAICYTGNRTLAVKKSADALLL
jgi:hypothetical protein